MNNEKNIPRQAPNDVFDRNNMLTARRFNFDYLARHQQKFNADITLIFLWTVKLIRLHDTTATTKRLFRTPLAIDYSGYCQHDIRLSRDRIWGGEFVWLKEIRFLFRRLISDVVANICPRNRYLLDRFRPVLKNVDVANDIQLVGTRGRYTDTNTKSWTIRCGR
jgi:hypothetical protein